MESLFDVPGQDPGADDGGAAASYATVASQGVADPSFPARVAVLLRSRPLADAAAAGDRRDWPEHTYDVATFALAAIDLVISKQGFEEEATYGDVVAGLTALAARAGSDRPGEEHEDVAMFTLDALLNRSQREAEFAYRISDFTSASTGHRQREVRFRLLVEREDPVRGEVVLNATRDAINALIGGLEFDVEDEQVANEVLLERQLARGSFDSAERSAIRARMLSVSLAEGLTQLIKDTRRDIRDVLDVWATDLPKRLNDAREHIQTRLEAEHRLHAKISESLEAEDPNVAASAARIAALLIECQRRHESLHRQVIGARGVFLDEQNRQSFRPPLVGHLPDLRQDILLPVFGLDTETALTVLDGWIGDIGGARAPRLPRLGRLVHDLWAVRVIEPDDDGPEDEDDLADPEEPEITAEAIEAAQRAVTDVGLPARLSALIAAALTDPLTTTAEDRQQAAKLVTIAALWCYPTEPVDDEGDTVGGGDLAARILGARAAADSDGLLLRLPGWDGDDLIIAPHNDALATASPDPVTSLPDRAEGPR